MAAKNSMPERAIAQTENAERENQQQIREPVRKKSIRALHGDSVHSAHIHERGEVGSPCCELYTHMECNYLPLTGAWLSRAGFRFGMAIKILVMSDCIVITPQNSRELWGCLEGLSATYINKQKVKKWLETFPGALNDTGGLPVK
ncbi:TPA: SymE family type I addiction module toxin [Enterobacter asburiae]|nr:SymE family type I addiction module toxin [Enterobacter asburiae]HDR2805345.1 SymE family type I addiction module toxin [Enterobacter asburiae]HDR2810863.1 SymE family type I addiction module toxin [Enterobacter asburiae]HDR2816240.1 SymE family type I addiction module toxin [Enterobacter asburiae]